MSKELTDICRVRVKFSETDAMQPGAVAGQ